MLGRFVAGLLAVMVIVLLPLKLTGISEARRNENALEYALCLFYDGVSTRGKVTEKDFSELINMISFSGINCYVEIEMGTIIYGKEQSVIEVSYTDELIGMIESSGDEGLDLKNRILTVRAVQNRENLSMRLANMFWDSFRPETVVTVGGYIHG
ncbi:MAG: hypothetical protein K6G24_13235 [Lachnospiraceae bacterium]|nr:hypothetical protein [Lachnospiraceae bacterium]